MTTKFTTEELSNMTREAIVDAIVAGQADPDDAKQAMTMRAATSTPDAQYTTTVIRRPEGADPELPTMVRIHGEAIDCPVRQQRTDETEQDYLDSLPSVKCHVGPLLWLLTAGRIPVLKSLIENLGTPKVGTYQSKWDSTRHYSRAIASVTNTDAHVQLHTTPNIDCASMLMNFAKLAVDNSTEEVKHYPDLHHTFRVNQTVPSDPELEDTSPF